MSDFYGSFAPDFNTGYLSPYTPVYPRGGSSRASRKTAQQRWAETKPVQKVVLGPVARLLGGQTGSTGYTLKNILTSAGAAGATAKVLVFEGDDGVTYYVDGATELAE